ncbi:HobA family DNA replication regulator [Campylobacter sp. JMF_01 NE2]|uniref:HobA family DNA replication regulator n=1 Tax=unclassified Campylobacter TaxID=2593542 RepID=UPI0022EA0EE2|nr:MULTISPECIES: HobA family DNA replication regulator [unclassified Campylobacter]MDA3052811.1 HobA family DNA replication regulator [Campylobacter sp. JMF_03 NE3]MDA3067142.1 HobA family DNA replication regulator [Campylobacter sp. JMF_01 NE2]
MQDLYTWSAKTLQNERDMEWLENRKEHWIPLLATKMRLLYSGYSFVVMCDDERRWFGEYIVSRINDSKNTRPLLPFFEFSSLYNQEITSQEQVALLNDMLSLSFSNGFIYFYIGRGDHAYAKIAKSHEDSYLWLIDEALPNSFQLSENDESLDIKLLQLFKILNKSIDAVLFGEVVL